MIFIHLCDIDLNLNIKSIQMEVLELLVSNFVIYNIITDVTVINENSLRTSLDAKSQKMIASNLSQSNIEMSVLRQSYRKHPEVIIDNVNMKSPTQQVLKNLLLISNRLSCQKAIDQQSEIPFI